MEEKVLKNVCIRLADGRFACLALASHPDGTFETTITTDGPTQKKIFSKKFEGQKEAVDFFEYLKEDRHVPEPVGRYKQLAVDLEQAKKYAQKQMGDDDSGSSNFDSVSIYLPRWRKKLVINAAKTAGLDCFKDGRSSRYLFSIPETGDRLTRTKAAEAASDFLNNMGYSTTVFYMLD